MKTQTHLNLEDPVFSLKAQKSLGIYPFINLFEQIQPSDYPVPYPVNQP
ncbi:hypothetical protein [Dolosigranulum pigrum]|nr:hypothetical protein [Dolosigranulum pigrum]